MVDGGPYETFACPSGTSVVDTGLVNGTTYYYTVSAAYTGGPNAGGESANSVQVSATPRGYSSSHTDTNANRDTDRYPDPNAYTTPTVQVTVQTNPAGRSFTVDGTTLHDGTDIFLGSLAQATPLPRPHRRAVAQAFDTSGVAGAVVERSPTPLRPPPTRLTQRHSGRNIT